MNKRNKILMIIFVILIIIMVIFFLKIGLSKKEKKTIEDMLTATTTIEERTKWSEFFKKNPYISEIELSENVYPTDTDLIKFAITSDDVELEYIVRAEILEQPDLTKGHGYKKSIKNIEEHIKKTFNKSNIEYNFVETYVENDLYLIINEEYVYFTEIELPEKEYILMKLTQKGNEFEAIIYEYQVNENNKTEINNMLESGNINPEIVKNDAYIITGTIDSDNICILTKE